MPILRGLHLEGRVLVEGGEVTWQLDHCIWTRETGGDSFSVHVCYFFVSTGFTTENFSWHTYLTRLPKSGPAAPKNLFANTQAAVSVLCLQSDLPQLGLACLGPVRTRLWWPLCGMVYLHLFCHWQSVTPHLFRVGMKLEAIDKKNSALTCVATVRDVLGDHILVHFDGWEDDYDYWCDPSSPYIKYVGWCQENAKPLSPPNGEWCRDLLLLSPIDLLCCPLVLSLPCAEGFLSKSHTLLCLHSHIVQWVTRLCIILTFQTGQTLRASPGKTIWNTQGHSKYQSGLSNPWVDLPSWVMCSSALSLKFLHELFSNWLRSPANSLHFFLEESVAACASKQTDVIGALLLCPTCSVPLTSLKLVWSWKLLTSGTPS